MLSWNHKVQIQRREDFPVAENLLTAETPSINNK